MVVFGNYQMATFGSFWYLSVIINKYCELRGTGIVPRYFPVLTNTIIKPVVVVDLCVDHNVSGFNKVWDITSVITPSKSSEAESASVNRRNCKALSTATKQ